MGGTNDIDSLQPVCIICQDEGIDFYDIMKHFCSDMTAIANNLCNKHIPSFNDKRLEFLMNK